MEGKGNGIKTVIVNMVDVAKALNRPPTCEHCFKKLFHINFLKYGLFFHLTYCNLRLDPTKFFGCELGAQTQFDSKNDRYIVNGSHEANKLQDMLDGFIRKFVLCPECDNPETDLVNISILSYTFRPAEKGHDWSETIDEQVNVFLVDVELCALDALLNWVPFVFEYMLLSMQVSMGSRFYV